MKPVYSVVLSFYFFAALILFSQGYSLVAGVSFIANVSTAVDGVIDGICTAPAMPEHVEDTDPEDIVTLDPFLLSVDFMKGAATLACAFILSLCLLLQQSPQKRLLPVRITAEDTTIRQRKNLLWLRHQALLD